MFMTMLDVLHVSEMLWRCEICARFTALLRSDSEWSQVASNTLLRYVLNCLFFWFMMTRKLKSHASNNCTARRVKLLKVTPYSRNSWKNWALGLNIFNGARQRSPATQVPLSFTVRSRGPWRGFEDALYWRCVYEMSRMLLGTYWRTSCWIFWGSGMKILKRASYQELLSVDVLR